MLCRRGPVPLPPPPIPENPSVLVTGGGPADLASTMAEPGRFQPQRAFGFRRRYTCLPESVGLALSSISKSPEALIRSPNLRNP